LKERSVKILNGQKALSFPFTNQKSGFLLALGGISQVGKALVALADEKSK